MADETTKLAEAESKAAAQGPSASSALDTSKPAHSHYEVLTDTWGHDRADRLAPRKGDILTADEVGPHHKWAVQSGVIAPIDAKDAKARRDASPSAPENVITAEDDAATAEKKTQKVMEANAHSQEDDLVTMTRKAEARTRADVERTRAAEARQSRENLKRI